LFGAKPLQPEKSTTASLGLVLRPDSTSSVTIDAYRLSIKNVITITDALQGAAVNKAFAAQAYVGYTQATYYRNAWDQRTDGVDIAGHKKWLLPVGTLDINASAAFHYTTVTNFHNTVQIEGTSVTALSNSHLRDQVDGVSRNKDVLEARYSHGPWSYSITGTRFSSYWYNAGNTPLVAASNGNIDQEFAPEIYWDLGVSYLTESNVRVDLKILNAFDRYPDQYVDGNRASGLNPYSFIAPNGASGRFIEVGATYKF
jgi:iron complex outermembrane receptor protein